MQKFLKSAQKVEGEVRWRASSYGNYLSEGTTSETIAHLLSLDLWLKGQVQPTVLQTEKRGNPL